MKKVAVLVLSAVLMCALTYMIFGPGMASAAGFALYEWDNRANGMGGAVIASQDPNPSAVAYNPAGMTKLEGSHAQAGVTFIAPSAHVDIQGTPGIWAGDEKEVDTKNRVFTVPHAFFTAQLDDDWWLGFGEFTRFGLGTHYDHSWAGRANMYKANMETFSFQPTVAYKATEELSLAFGLEFLYGRMDLRKDLRALTPLGDDWHLFPEGYGTSWNLSALWTPTDWFSMGLVYRNAFKFFGTGDADFLNNAGDDTMKMRADFPGSWSYGISVKPCDTLTLEADFIYTTWSNFRKMEYYFSDETVAAIPVGITENKIDSIKGYKDAMRFQLGAEWEAWDSTFLRGGFIFDESPQNDDYVDYMLPSNDRYLVTTGLGFDWGNFDMDFSLMYLWAKDRTIDNAMTGTAYSEITDSTTWLGGLSVSYTF